jgi:hypothetical protein
LAGSLTVNAGRDGRAQLRKKSVSYQLEGLVFPKLSDLPQASVQWKVKNGPGAVRFKSQTGLSTRATFRKAGRYEIELSVSSLGITVTDSIIVRVRRAR